MKKKLTIIAALAFSACLALFALAGCGGGGGGGAAPSSDADVEAIAAEMDKNVVAFEEGLASVSKAFVEDDSIAPMLETFQLTADEFSDALTKHMKISYDNIKVDGDKATVDMIVTMPDYAAFEGFLEEKLTAAVEELDVASMTESEAYAKVGKLLVDVIASDDLPTVTETMTIDYAKTGDKWAFADQDAVQEEFRDLFAVS